MVDSSCTTHPTLFLRRSATVSNFSNFHARRNNVLAAHLAILMLGLSACLNWL